jgi:hypothetical protein
MNLTRLKNLLPLPHVSLVLFSLLIFHVGCDGRQRRNTPTYEESFNARQLARLGLNAFNGRISMSADGSKLAFVSGRHLSGEGKVDGSLALQAFRLQVNMGESPSLDQLLTVGSEGELGSVLEINYSPDGRWLGVVASKDGSRGVYLFDHQSQSLTSVSSGALDSDLRFSPDSKLFAFNRISASSEGKGPSNKVYLGSVTNPSEVVVLPNEGQDQLFTWLPESSGYRLGVVPSQADESVLESYGFSQLSSLPSSSEGRWGGETYRLDSSIPGVISAGSLLIAHRPLVPERLVEAFIPEKTEGAELKSIVVASQPMLIQEGGEQGSDALPLLGHKVLDLASDATGDHRLTVERLMYTCDGNQLEFGNVMVLYEEGQSRLIVPVFDSEAGQWILRSNPCDVSLANASQGLVDLTVSQARIATQGALIRIVYASMFQDVPKVVVLDIKDEATTFSSL